VPWGPAGRVAGGSAAADRHGREPSRRSAPTVGPAMHTECRAVRVQRCARGSRRRGSGVVDAARRPGAELEPVVVDRFTTDIALPVGATSASLALARSTASRVELRACADEASAILLDRSGGALADALAESDRCAVVGWRSQPLDGAPQVCFFRFEFRPASASDRDSSSTHHAAVCEGSLSAGGHPSTTAALNCRGQRAFRAPSDRRG